MEQRPQDHFLCSSYGSDRLKAVTEVAFNHAVHYFTSGALVVAGVGFVGEALFHQTPEPARRSVGRRSTDSCSKQRAKRYRQDHRPNAHVQLS